MNIDSRFVEQLVEDAAADWSGVVRVDVTGETLFVAAFGYANRADAIENRIDTRFAQASGSKTFTAVAVAQLVESGHFAFESPVVGCLRRWPSGFSPDVTVHQLLTHTSGIPDYFDEEEEDQDYEDLWKEQPSYMIKEPADILPLFENRPMKSAPGKRFSYSNSGYVLLGLLIEQHAGMPFSEYIESSIFGRAGMSDSGYFTLDRLPPRTAFNYLTFENPTDPRTNIFTVPVKGQPDGGAFVTAGDMALFWQALANNVLIDDAHTNRLTSTQTATDNPRESYGYGVSIEHHDGRLIHRSQGGDPGVNFVSGVDLESMTSVTVISNAGGVARIYSALRDAVLDESSP